MSNLKEDSFKLLRKSLIIFEVDGIDYELIFEGKKKMTKVYRLRIYTSHYIMLDPFLFS
jgi:hypothetical protein